jgi:hypothetical protein
MLADCSDAQRTSIRTKNENKFNLGSMRVIRLPIGKRVSQALNNFSAND